MRRSVQPTGNRLLDRILSHEPSLRPELRPLELPALQVIYRPDDRVTHVYFPTRGVISLIVRFSAGNESEVGTVGSEGVAGVPAVLGVRKSPLWVMQQVPGPLLRLSLARFLHARDTNRRIEQLVRCYTAYFLRSAQQFAACNASHRLSCRAARWILMTADRVGAPEFTLTQEVIGQMLGVGRQAVSETANVFQRCGLIRYTRGRMEVLDRRGLEVESCECYGVVNRAYEEDLG